MSQGRPAVLVLAGGPDREREVSLQSGACVAAALREAGYVVTQRDITPMDLSPLDAIRGDMRGVVFPVLHGPWGEGGPLQRILEERSLTFVGCRSGAASLCIDKKRTKEVVSAAGVDTPAWALISPGNPRQDLPLPAVVKPNDEGSSIDLSICRTRQQMDEALARLTGKYEQVLVERYVTGMEMTVGVLGSGQTARALPPIRIVPAADVEYYDYQAKYVRNDTRYLLDPAQIGLPPERLAALQQAAVRAFRAAGCRHLSRVDFIVDAAGVAWFLEINTLPGFTTHSLLPKAAAHAGMSMPELVDQLVRWAASERGS